MKPYMFSLLFFVLFHPKVDAGNIRIEFGRMTIDGYNECNVSINNGDMLNILPRGNLYVYDGIVFGLISWWCDSEYGSIIKNIECKDCGIYCTYNQQFEMCKTSAPVSLGAILGAIIFLLLLSLVLTIFKEKIINITDKVIVYFITADDRKRVKKIKNLNKITGLLNPIKFKPITTKSDKINSMIVEKRMNFRKDVTGDEPIYGEICNKDSNDDIEYMEVIERRLEVSPHNILGRPVMPLPQQSNVKYAKTYKKPPMHSLYTTTVMIMCIINIISCCDKTLYLSTQGKICDKSNCLEMNTYQLSIRNGQVVCFNTPEGKTLKLHLRDTNIIVRYQAIYYTCQYTIETQSTYECKAAWSNCYYGGTCYQGYKYPSLIKDTANPHGYGCTDGVIGCDVHCTSQVSCTWYRWELIPDKKKCEKVYNKISEIWETDVIIDYNNMRKVITLNTNNPTNNMNKLNMTGLLELPIAIMSLLYESVHIKDSLLINNNQGYEIHASQINMPIKNMIGEHQMSLDGKTMTYYTSRPEVISLTCDAKAMYDEPALLRLLSTKQPTIKKEYLLRSGEYIIKRKIPINGLANVMIGSMKFDHLFISPSYCRVKVEQSYGCIGCNVKPYIILKSYEIKNEGLLEFETNCTWSQSSLSCNLDPYIMTLDDNSDICFIHIPSTNQTIIINFNYVFTGDVTMLKTYYSESSIEAIKNLAGDKDFWFGIMSSFNAFAIISVLLTFCVKLFNKYIKNNYTRASSTIKTKFYQWWL